MTSFRYIPLILGFSSPYSSYMTVLLLDPFTILHTLNNTSLAYGTSYVTLCHLFIVIKRIRTPHLRIKNRTHRYNINSVLLRPRLSQGVQPPTPSGYNFSVNYHSQTSGYVSINNCSQMFGYNVSVNYHSHTSGYNVSVNYRSQTSGLMWCDLRVANMFGSRIPAKMASKYRTESRWYRVKLHKVCWAMA